MRIAIWSGSGLGGTEKAAFVFAAGLKERGHTVDFLGGPGARTGFLEAAGIPIIGAGNDDARMLDYLLRTRPDVVHQHVPGYPLNNPIYRVWSRLPPPAPALIETNIFGRLDDPVGDKIVKFRMFISLSSATQAFFRAGRPLDARALEDQTAVLFPTEAPAQLTAERRRQLRAELGVGPEHVLAIRTGRVSPKWADWECRAFAIARAICPNLRMLLMEPPPQLTARIHAGEFGSGICVRPETADFEWLRELYSASDLMIHASDYGESFGYSISEGLAAGLPLIVRTTPWCDNAQVELVDNGCNGFVCASVPEMARRFVELARDTQLRSRLGAAACAKMQNFARLSEELDLLEEVLRKVQNGATGPNLRRRNEELLTFAKTFHARQWQISERATTHPFNYSTAKAYSAYRSLRTMIRRRIDLWRWNRSGWLSP